MLAVTSVVFLSLNKEKDFQKKKKIPVSNKLVSKGINKYVKLLNEN